MLLLNETNMALSWPARRTVHVIRSLVVSVIMFSIGQVSSDRHHSILLTCLLPLGLQPKWLHGSLPALLRDRGSAQSFPAFFAGHFHSFAHDPPSRIKLPLLQTATMGVLRRLPARHLDICGLHVLLRQTSAHFLVRFGVGFLAITGAVEDTLA